MKHGLIHAFGFVTATLLALVAGPAGADAVGPYYATPSWDQSLPGSTRFVVLTNFNSEAVLDRETGLVWERTPHTGTIVATQPPGTFAGYAALDCMVRKIGGRFGWRLPSMQEFYSLVDDTQTPIALPAGNPFVGITGGVFDSFWSATTSRLGTGTSIFVMDFTAPNGFILAPPESTERVWCVRGGSGPDQQ
jgi:hypothetical protein